MRDIGKNIRDLRSKRNMTQDELAEKLFVTRQTVSNYETGRSRPDLDMLVKISEVLACDTDALLFGLPKPEKKWKDKLPLVLGTILFLALTVTAVLWRREMRAQPFDSSWTEMTVWLYFVRIPAFFLAGWLVPTAAVILFDMKRPTGKWVRVTAWTVIGLIAFFLMRWTLMAVDALLLDRTGSRQISNWLLAFLYPEGKSIPELILFWLERQTAFHWVFSVLGLLLGLTGLPKMRDKSGENVVS